MVASLSFLAKSSRIFATFGRNCQLSYSFIRYSHKLVTKEVIGSVAVIGINRPEKKNAVNRETAQELRTAFRDFEKNDNEKVAVLFGHGGTFCAGYDLMDVMKLSPEKVSDFMNEVEGPMGPSRMMLSKPVIAAVEGYAVAGGLELALMCDLRVMEETAIMGVLCRRYGVPLIDGGTIRLPKLIGLSRALDLILTGREVTAQEALQMGLVNRVIPTGTAVGQAIKLADNLSRLPQVCLNTDRQSAYNAAYSDKNMPNLFKEEAKYGTIAMNDLMKAGRRDALELYSSKMKTKEKDS